MQIPRMSLRQLAWSGTVLLLVGTLLLAWSAVRQQESTLAIRAVHQGTTMPDGFSIWHLTIMVSRAGLQSDNRITVIRW